jgi:hypothetical protein
VGFLHHVNRQPDEIGWEVIASLHRRSMNSARRCRVDQAGGLNSSHRAPLQCWEGGEAAGVFTVFCPSCLRLDIPEPSGFADPSVTNPNRHYLRNHPLGQKLSTLFRACVKTVAVRRVRRFWVEASTARSGSARRLGISPIWLRRMRSIDAS